MKVFRLPSVVPRAQTATFAKNTGVTEDTAAAQIAAAKVRRDEFDDAPRLKYWDDLASPATLDEMQPPEIASPTLDLVAYLARRSILAYDPEEGVLQDIGKEEGTDCQRFEVGTDAGFAYLRGRTAVIAIRGTVPTCFRQWFATNLRFLTVGEPPRHRGFEQAWQRLRPKVLEWLSGKLPPGGDIVLTGHSLGGAMAIIAALDLSDLYPVRAVVTLGAPCVGREEFRDAYLKKASQPGMNGKEVRCLAEITRRVMHVDDFFARLPPPPIFRYIGEGFRLDESGHLALGESKATIARILRFFDSSIGWVYRQLDTLYRPTTIGGITSIRATTSSGTPGSLQKPRLPPIYHPSSAEPERPTGRLMKDLAGGRGGIPWIAFLTLQTFYWILLGGSLILALGIFFLGLGDLWSHKSGLYQAALKKRYQKRKPDPMGDIFRKIRDSV